MNNMPAYSFQERFVSMLKDGSKRQTIRKHRKGQAKPGDKIYLYFGMRTKYCTKIGEGICTKVASIMIDENGAIFLDSDFLTTAEKDILAYRDGFLPEGSTEENCKGAFDLMFLWWKQTHELPFYGEVIYFKHGFG